MLREHCATEGAINYPLGTLGIAKATIGRIAESNEM
jgi:hypothetical protein